MSQSELFEYQRDGVKWLKEKKCALLADEMGLGKSAQSIVAAEGLHRILIICPAIARLNWLRELDRFSKTPREFVVVSEQVTIISDSKSVITSFNLASKIDPNVFGVFDAVIIDEVHYLKSHLAIRTSKIFGRKGIIHGQKSTTKIWCLSGTPAPNHAGELWPLLYTFGVTNLGYQDFIQRFCNYFKNPLRKEIQITGTKRERIPELRKLLTKVMLRRMKQDVAPQLPKISFSTIVVEPGKVEFDMESSFIQYVFPQNRVKELEKKLAEEVKQVKAGINTNDIEVLKGLAKSVSTLRRYIGIQKVEKAAQLIAEELEAKLYDKIVVFAIHRDVIEGLRTRLKDFNPLTLYGGTGIDKAYKSIDKFQTYDKFKVFIGNITACGVAINLSRAHNVIMVEQDWTPAANAQAIARCHRHGQTNPVSVRMVSLADSFDEKICQILKRKTQELTELFDDDNHAQPITLNALLK